MERRARGVLVAFVLCLVPQTMSSGTEGATAATVHSSTTSTCIFDRLSLHIKDGVCRPRAKAYPPHVRSRVKRAIYDASLTFGIPFSVLLKIGRCESGLNPRAANGGHLGLFQFAPATFRGAVTALRRETGIVARNLWNPLDSAYAAGYMFVTGGSRSWSCEHL